MNGIGDFLGDGHNSPASFVRHIDHIAQLVGPEHVAIGLDFVFDTQELDEYLRRMQLTFPEKLGYRPGVRDGRAGATGSDR